MKRKKRTVRLTTRRPERTVDEAIQILWKVIDEAKMHLEAEMTTSEEKRSWAKVLCDTVGVFNACMQGSHDDQLFALTLACYASKEKERAGKLAPAW